MSDDVLLTHEIENHRFTEPLKTVPPPSLARRAVARLSNRVWFRVGWTCPHLRAVLISAEKEMLLRSELNDQLDIYQLQGNASASAGTHALPGAGDLGQTSDAQITTLRRNGGDFQRRTTSQGFDVEHCHGFAQGCDCGSRSLLVQKRKWNQRLNGLVSNGPVLGLWPTKKWSTAVKERKKVIVAFTREIAKETAAEVLRNLPKPPTPPTPSAIWAVQTTAPDGRTKWTAGHVLSWLGRMFGSLSERSDAQDKKIAQLAADVAAIKTKIGA